LACSERVQLSHQLARRQAALLRRAAQLCQAGIDWFNSFVDPGEVRADIRAGSVSGVASQALPQRRHGFERLDFAEIGTGCRWCG
jgi:hypothetical protein